MASVPQSSAYTSLMPGLSRRMEWWLARLDPALGACLVLMLMALPLSEALKNGAFGVALVLWLMRQAVRRERIHVPPLGWGLLAFLAVAVLSASVGLDRYQGARGAWDTFRYVSTFFLILHGLTSREQARWCIGALVVSVVLGAGIGLGKYLSMEMKFFPANRLISKTEAEAKSSFADPETRRRSMDVLIASWLELGDSYKEIQEALGVGFERIARVEKSLREIDENRLFHLQWSLGDSYKEVEDVLIDNSPAAHSVKERWSGEDRRRMGELKQALLLVSRVNRGTVAVKVHSVGHPNHSATYMVIMFGLALAGALERSFRPPVRAALAGAGVLLAVATIFTYSRAGAVLMILVIVGMLLLTRRGRWAVGLVVLSVALVAVPRVRAFVPRVVSAFQHPMQVGAIRDRVHVWRTVVFGVVRDRPLLGAGPRNFNTIDKRRYGLEMPWDYFDHAHSLYMNVAAEMGLLGLGALFFFLVLFLRAWLAARERLADPLYRVLWLGSGGAFFIVTVSGLITTTLHTENAMLLMSIWGLWFFVRGASEENVVRQVLENDL